ncbi:MAG: rhomboid family intramembrane serine protease [Desulfobacteraceae bacterium]|nr:rhomboid family intramembrane serine protease [Desulfobacteraceae bacterium]
MEMEIIFKSLPQKKADLILLILESQGIITRVEKRLTPTNQILVFDILVPREHRAAAVKSIDQYFQENKFFNLKNKLSNIEISSFNVPTAYVIMALLVAIHLICLKFNIHREMILKFGASSLYLAQGQTFRAITALFLHSNGQHLLGNLAGIIIFAAPLISLSGYGTGPLLLLCSGTWGNLINAYFHQNALLSIGTSTAIMGAAGSLAAYQMINHHRPFQLKRLIPLFAAATLMGMFSQGENTDVSAHVFGFMAGIFWGILFFPCYQAFCRVVSPKLIEAISLILVLTILGAAFWAGV